MTQSEQALSILNKIATFERSKRLTETQKAMLIRPLQEQLDALTGQGSLPLTQGLEGGATPSSAPPKAAK